MMLEQLQLVELTSLAQARGMSVSKLARKYIQDGIEVEKVDERIKYRNVSPRQRMLKSVANIRRLKLADKPTDASLNHDHYLYGAPRRYGSS